jgi:hypothetical protein
MIINKDQLLDIAKRLEYGDNVYLNKDTGEYRSLPDVEEFPVNSDFYTDELRKIINRWENYMILTRMESWELFEVLETSKYRNHWYHFKTEKYLNYVREQLQVEGIEMESNDPLPGSSTE